MLSSALTGQAGYLTRQLSLSSPPQATIHIISPPSCRDTVMPTQTKASNVNWDLSVAVSVEPPSFPYLKESWREAVVAWIFYHYRVAEDSHTGRCTLARASAPWPIPQNPISVEPTTPTSHHPWAPWQGSGRASCEPDRAWSGQVGGAARGSWARGWRRSPGSTRRPHSDWVSTEMRAGVEEISASFVLLRYLLR